MTHHLSLTDILFLDIETVSLAPDYQNLTPQWQTLWGKKSRVLRNLVEEDPSESYQKAGIYAEFGKVVCISTGRIGENGLVVRSYYGHEEKPLLEAFAHELQTNHSGDRHLLCAHNGKEFDFPYLARRMLVQGLPLPDILNTAGKKPWEVNHLDTMELWKFGDYKHYTSLELLVHLLGIPSPKQDLDGSEVGRVYWVDHDLMRIVEYCQRDVVALVRLFLRFQNAGILSDEDITYAPSSFSTC